ncbi:OPT oligopeptide transporter [Mycena chlorophos]|uniref:OPT oligopeptide transporter n=1 Tax=Mycena chlorophos TaxID=658473 RepID=A0A8H6W1Q6_MYCCL|nr:OPT oligopeptide transporter [Mycena chlorophos]
MGTAAFASKRGSLALSLYHGTAKLLDDLESNAEQLLELLIESTPFAVLAICATFVFLWIFYALLGVVSSLAVHEDSDATAANANPDPFDWTVKSRDLVDVSEGGLLSLTLFLAFALGHYLYTNNQLEGSCREMLAKRDELVSKTTAAKSYATHTTRQLAELSQSLTCVVCTDRLSSPYTLHPCGHTFDSHCLDNWFRSAPLTQRDHDMLEAMRVPTMNGLYRTHPGFLLGKQKFCPLCKVEIKVCPAPARALLMLGGMTVEDDQDEVLLWRELFAVVPELEKKMDTGTKTAS